eukprot:CAMPEP_0185583266 /NCGR_PEP_ID=MMETSP0434-20130131/21414_1 /TAXON_ID=626734 ORGANISM="Favella taraikaensis, Strain Fe Narragansett Bay" /NCGR_SAMPLE_ID=MMETSP0434 /ASSEMBLY_ACC=CAM_ASM_000379 /LENGTH=124 /DNA_ID=CAMNT_0028202293 /DNA_START=874 /DNA_END=1248 /DNA_ORIENTATION=-
MADAVIDPGAVVVHFEHAETALAAVVRAHRFPRLFPRALLAVLHFHVLALERRRHALRDPAWVRKCRPDVADIGHEAKAVENGTVDESFESEWDSLDPLLVHILFQMPVENVASVRNVLTVHDQ